MPLQEHGQAGEAGGAGFGGAGGRITPGGSLRPGEIRGRHSFGRGNKGCKWKSLVLLGTGLLRLHTESFVLFNLDFQGVNSSTFLPGSHYPVDVGACTIRNIELIQVSYIFEFILTELFSYEH